MTQNHQSINSHIEEYLDYYCELTAPGFAILLQGEWGSGKTWFIDKYREKIKDHKCLYISLYGMTSFSDIEDTFFQQLHPILSSKGMAITGKIFKGLLKGSLKIDLDGDKKDDGTVSIQIPDINLPKYLKDTDKCILIFDDLERCKIDLSNVLGYINSFVEHQDLKVILIANERELEKDPSYKSIKEKIIGKTFGVLPDFNSALEVFLTMVNHTETKTFLCENTEQIQDLYAKAEYENLRNLKQIILDFEKIFKILPEKAQSKKELLQHLLQVLTAFSLEIKCGKILPKNITHLYERYESIRSKPRKLADDIPIEEDDQELKLFKAALNSYPFLNIDDPFPSNSWWQDFFDKGIINTEELEQNLLTSRLFLNETPSNWAKLCRFKDLSDDEFDLVVEKVESEWKSFNYDEIEVIMHVCGIFLVLSDNELYKESKNSILDFSKRYVDHLRENNKLPLVNIEDISGYLGLGFQGEKSSEFKELRSYINEVQKTVRIKNLPIEGEKLLDIMQNNVSTFSEMICWNKRRIIHSANCEYCNVSIFKDVKPAIFLEKLSFMNRIDKECAFWALKERYNHNIENLIEELNFLISLKKLLEQEVNDKRGKVSGFNAARYITSYLNEPIQKLTAGSKRIRDDQIAAPPSKPNS